MRRQHLARVVPVSHEALRQRRFANLVEWPDGGYRIARFQRYRHEGPTPSQFVGRYDTARRDVDRLAFEHRRYVEEILLLHRMEWGIVTACAFHLDTQEGPAEDMGLGGHGCIILSRHPEPGWTHIPIAPHLNQVGDEPVHRFVVQERFMYPPAKGAGVVQVGFDDVGVFGEDVLPERHPVVGPTRVTQ